MGCGSSTAAGPVPAPALREMHAQLKQAGAVSEGRPVNHHPVHPVVDEGTAAPGKSLAAIKTDRTGMGGISRSLSVPVVRPEKHPGGQKHPPPMPARMRRPEPEGAAKVAVYSSRKYDEEGFEAALEEICVAKGLPKDRYFFRFLDEALNENTAILAKECVAVCLFVNDECNSAALRQLNLLGVKLVLLRCVGFNKVSLDTADAALITVSRVPEYSPNAVAEHSVALLLALNRKVCAARERTIGYDFSLDGLTGFNLYGKTVGIVGMGRIGICAANIYKGCGCKLLAPMRSSNKIPDGFTAGDIEFVPEAELLARVDVLSLHCPGTPATAHMVKKSVIAQMKPTAIIVNVARGSVCHTADVLDALDSGRLGGFATDVYENEGPFFFKNLAYRGSIKNEIEDPLLKRLLRNPKVLLSGHQGFLTQEALAQIASVTVNSLHAFMSAVDAGSAQPHTAIPAANLISFEKMKGRLIKRDWWRIAKIRSRLVVHLMGAAQRSARLRGATDPGVFLPTPAAALTPEEEELHSGPAAAVGFKEKQREYYDTDV